MLTIRRIGLITTAALASALLGACDRASSHAVQQNPGQLGFKPLGATPVSNKVASVGTGWSPLKVGTDWASLRDKHLLHGALLAPDSSAVLLVFNGPVDWPGAPPPAPPSAKLPSAPAVTPLATTPPAPPSAPASTPPANAPDAGDSAAAAAPPMATPPPTQPNAVWVDLAGATPQAVPCYLPGSVFTADFKLRQVICLHTIPPGQVSPQMLSGGRASFSVQDVVGYDLYDVASRQSQPYTYGKGAPSIMPPPRMWVDNEMACKDPYLAPGTQEWARPEWTYKLPVSASSGTGRPDVAAQPGTLELGGMGADKALSVAVGSLPFTTFAGDAQHQRGFLALDGAGVMLADMTPGATQPLRWLLRDSSGAQFFLQPQAGKLIVATDDGLSVISLSELADLAPRLNAAQALTTQQIRLLRPVAKALGWDWTAVQFNPLATAPGQLSLLDTSDPDSATAELAWSPTSQRALHLLITRQPRPEDEALRTADATARDSQILALLKQLGWPNASAPASQPGSAAGEVQLSCVLDPTALAPRDPGKFTLWLTADAAVWELQGATSALPQDAVSSDMARKLAIGAAQSATGFSASPQALPGGGAVALFAGLPHAGWGNLSSRPFKALAPEQYKDAKPVLEVPVLQTGRIPLVYIVRVGADGQGTTVGQPTRASFEVLSQARRGDFGPDAAQALAAPAAAPPSADAGSAGN